MLIQPTQLDFFGVSLASARPHIDPIRGDSNTIGSGLGLGLHEIGERC